MKFKHFALMAVFAVVAITFVACGQTGSGSNEALATLPDAEYQWIMTINPNELINSQFVKNVKEGFPMAAMLFTGIDEQANETGIKLEEIDVISVFFKAGEFTEPYAFAQGSFKQEAAIKQIEEEKGIKLEEIEKDGLKYFAEEDGDKAMYFAGNTAVQSSKEAIEKLVDTVAGNGKKYIDSEAYKTASKYFDHGQTFSFYAANFGEDAAINTASSAAFEMFEKDAAKVEALTEAANKISGMGAKIKVTNAVKGDVAILFSDAEAAKLLANFLNDHKDEMFEKAAEEGEQAATMTGLKYNREKMLALKNCFSYKAEGEAVIVGINLSWDNISFLFEK